MSTTTNAQDPIWEAILQYCGANAISVANAYYGKVKNDTANSLTLLRNSTIASITAAIKASFSIASAQLILSVVDAAAQVGGAVGAYSGLSEMSAGEKELQQADTATKKIQEEEKGLTKQLEKASTEEKPNIQKELDELKPKNEASQKLLKRKQEKQSNVVNKANIKSTTIQMAATGAASMPKALEDAEQTKGRAIKDVLDQLVQMLGSTYQKSNETLKSFFDFDYLGGLVALGQIQLR